MATIYSERAVVDSNVAGTRHDVVALLARVLLVAMFVVSGFGKATGFAGTVSLIASIAIYTIAAGLLFHAYWNDAPANWFDDYINFWKNVSIAGGFLMIFAFGPGRYSIGRG